MESDITLLDIGILAFVGFGIWRGFQKGAILEVAKMLGLVLAFVLAVQLMDTAGLLVVSSLNLSEDVTPLVGFVVVFAGTLLVVTMAARFVQYLVGAIKLGGVNKLIGGAVGAAKSAQVLSIAFLLLQPMNIPNASSRDDSSLYRSVETLAPATWDALSTALPKARSLSERFPLLKVADGHVEQAKRATE